MPIIKPSDSLSNSLASLINGFSSNGAYIVTSITDLAQHRTNAVPSLFLAGAARIAIEYLDIENKDLALGTVNFLYALDIGIRSMKKDAKLLENQIKLLNEIQQITAQNQNRVVVHNLTISLPENQRQQNQPQRLATGQVINSNNINPSNLGYKDK